MKFRYFCTLAVVSLCGLIQVSRADRLRFPDGFKWCIATSAYQTEGNDFNSDWWDWEYSTYKNGIPHIWSSQHSGLAIDHWNRLDQDTKVLVDLNVKTLRFSIEWAKLEPTEGVFDTAVAEHYRKEIEILRQNNIEPMITLYHYTLPLWVAAHGGWEWNGIPAVFGKFTEYVYKNIGPGVHDYITLNEPTVAVIAGYVVGKFPPGKQGVDIVKPIENLLKAHSIAFSVLHAAAQTLGFSVRVGVAHHLRVFDPFNPKSAIDKAGVELAEEFFNWSFVNAVDTGHLKISFPLNRLYEKTIKGLAHTQDFIGVNYYSRDMVKVTAGQPEDWLKVKAGSLVSNLNWEIYPEGIYRVLKEVHKRYPDQPILITENGVADSDDHLRPQFILDHLKYIHKAIQDGVPVKGYCHWSATDSFEWDEGFQIKFGLYSVNPYTLERIQRPSGALFSQIAADNALPTDPASP